MGFKDRYEEAVSPCSRRQAGRAVEQLEAATSNPNVINLMEALKRSLAGTPPPKDGLKVKKGKQRVPGRNVVAYLGQGAGEGCGGEGGAREAARTIVEGLVKIGGLAPFTADDRRIHQIAAGRLFQSAAKTRDHARGTSTGFVFKTQETAIAALRRAGDRVVSVQFTWNDELPQHVQIGMTARQAADLLLNVVDDRKSAAKGGRKPNAALAEALEEGRTLKGRFSTAQELFDALETGKN